MNNIKLRCPECGKKLSASEDKAGKRAKCPSCGAMVDVPRGELLPSDPYVDAEGVGHGMSTKGLILLLLFVALICSTVVTSLLALKAWAEARQFEQRLIEVTREKQQMSARIDALETQAQAALNAAREQAQRITEEAQRTKEEAHEIRRAAEIRAATQEKRLHEVFGDLKRYRAGVNYVRERYISSLIVTQKGGTGRGDVEITMTNRGNYPVKPNFEIHFISQYGFVTDNCSIVWLLSKIQPGETRIENSPVDFRYGEPVYFTIEFRD